MAELNGHEGGNAGHGQAKPTGRTKATTPAEGMEGRGLAKGNAGPQNTPRTQNRKGVPSALDRIRQAAKTDKERRFTDAPAPRLQHRDRCGGVLRPQEERGTGSRRRDVGAVRRAPGREPQGPLRAPAAGSVPSEAGPAGVHPEGGRAAAAARGHRAGGQDRPAGRRRGAERHLRGGLPRLLLRVPAWAQPARRAGCALRRDRDGRR